MLVTIKTIEVHCVVFLFVIIKKVKFENNQVTFQVLDICTGILCMWKIHFTPILILRRQLLLIFPKRTKAHLNTTIFS